MGIVVNVVKELGNNGKVCVEGASGLYAKQIS